jgi:hypothetical protein
MHMNDPLCSAICGLAADEAALLDVSSLNSAALAPPFSIWDRLVTLVLADWFWPLTGSW